MQTEFEYYYNTVPGKGLCRNNLIYTSLISKDRKTFCQWYYNDTGYHKGHNEVVDRDLMEEKWQREVKFLNLVKNNFPDDSPEILEIDYNQKKIYLKIDGYDFWQQHFDKNLTFDELVPDWDEQILKIVKNQISLKFYKYSVHPSSYFLVDNQLKCINYFFCYNVNEPGFSLNQVSSHISKDRKASAIELLKQHSMTPDTILTLDNIQHFILESFKKDYPTGFIDQVQNLYKNKNIENV